MARTNHDARAEHRTERATREMRLRAASTIADALDGIAERREAQHMAELARRDRAYSDRTIGDVLGRNR